MNYIEKNTDEYFTKTYAGWLGKIIGIRMGSPIEGWTYDKIKGTYGFVDRYVQDYDDYAADDDSNGPLFFIRSLLDFSSKGENLTPDDMAETWLNYVSNGHGFFWWGGYGISTEHTAYRNLKNGIGAPESGSIRQNGHTIAEQIGGQIFIDSWGFVKPGDPVGAAELAKKMICVSHDGEALYGGAFVVACISAAYTACSVREIIERALPVLPENSIYRKVVMAVMDYYDSDSEKDWEGCYRFIHRNFGYDRFPGNCHIIPNAALIILSLLYGEGEYGKSIYICNSCGWDTDCNAGNVGAILGVYTGIDGIPDNLISPVKDLVLASSAIGYLNINTISESAEMFARIGCRLAGVDPAGLWNSVSRHKKYYNFNLPKSTNAIRTNGCIAFENKRCSDGHGALFFYGKGDVYFKTYYRPSDLTDSRYDPSFSPLIYPGEEFHFSVCNSGHENLMARPYFRNGHDERIHFGKKYSVGSGDVVDVSMSIPSGDALVDRIGFCVEEGNEFRLDSFSIDGKVDCCMDFSKEKEDDFGFGHSGLHKERSQFSFSDGYWEYKDGFMTGSCASEGETLTGEYGLRDYCISANIIPIKGEHHFLIFRAQGLARYYAVGFDRAGHIAILRKHGIGYERLAEASFDWTCGTTYKILADVVGDRLRIFIDDILVLDIVDSSYSSGCYGFAVMDASRCRFFDLHVKEY